MHHSKLFQLLRTLEANEIHWLHKFLKSPYHNSNQQYLQLFEYIKKYYPNLEHPKLRKEIVYEKLFQDKRRTLSEASDAFDAQKMRKLMHELAVLVEEFLVIHHVKNNAFEHRKIFIAELGRRNYYKAFEKEIHKLLHELEQEEKKDESHFLERYQLRKQLFGHPLTVRGQESGAKLLEMSEELDSYYFLHKLKLDAALKSNKSVYSTKNQIPFIEEIQTFFDKKIKISSPESSIYNHIHQLFTLEHKKKSFDRILLEYNTQKNYLSKKTKLEVLQSLISYTFSEIGLGNTSFVVQQFELYKLGLEDDVIIQNNKITKNTFSNIVSCGAFLQEYEWTEKFIKEKSNFLNDEEQNEVVTLNLANLYFKQGKYEKSLNHLKNIYFNNILYLSSAKVLLIECYFELFLNNESYVDILIAQMNSFEKLLRREKKMNGLKKSQLLNFILFVRRLTRSIIENKDIKGLTIQLKNTSIIVAKPWLISKLSSLDK